MATTESVNTFFGTLQAAGVNPPPGFSSQVAAAIWAAALPEVSDAQLRAGALLWLRSEKGHFWPTPRAVLDLVQGAIAPVDAPESVWERMLLCIGRYGYYLLTEPDFKLPPLSDDPRQHAIALAALRSHGGWSALCMTEHDQLPHFRRTFLATMVTLSQQDRTTATGELYSASVQRIEQRQAQKNQRSIADQGEEASRIVSELAEKMKAGGEP